jgi:pimeloyl-ACP methyl ester carboxylesterase
MRRERLTRATFMRLTVLLAAASLATGAALAQTRSDGAREKRWADQIVPNLVVGDAQYLQSADGTRFLALHTAAPNARAAVVLTHGPGLHPDHGITGELRVHLAERGYTTLSLQMPVLGADDEGGPEYAKLFPEAALRIAAGIRFLQEKGARRVAIVSHAMGSAMAYAYLRHHRDAPVFAWAALSFYGVFKDMARAPMPIFDLYGSSDYRGIRGPADDRKRILETIPGSRQLAVPEGGRFLAGGEKTVLTEVTAFLDRAAK